MELKLKRIFALLAILLIVGQSFFYSVASAGVQPWKGNPWEGDSWEGSPWNPQQFQWEGEDWEGNGTTGNGTIGNGTNGNGTSGNGTTGDGTSGDSWNGDGTTGNGTTGEGTTGNGTTGDGTTGNGTTGNGTTGDGTTGNGTSGNGTNGNGTTGDGTTGNGTAGNGTTGNGTSGNGTNGNGTNGDGTSGNGTEYGDPTAGEIARYVGFDIIHNQVGLADQLVAGTTPGQMGASSGFFLSGLLLNGLKLKYEGNPYLEGASTLNDLGDKGYVAGQSINTYRSLRATSDTATTLARGATTTASAGAAWSTMGALGKLNVVGAGAAALYGGYDTFNKAKTAIGNYGDSSISTSTKVAQTAEATASLGTTIMSAGVVVGGLVPGGQAVGALMVAGGAALWGVSKLTGAVANNWGSIKKFGSDVGNKISDGWNALKGVFS